jgi:hypothetical protein
MKDLTPPGASYVSSRGNGTWPFFFFVTNFVLMPIFFKLASEEMSASTAIDSSCLKFRTLNLNHRGLYYVQFVMEPGFGLIGVPRACLYTCACIMLISSRYSYALRLHIYAIASHLQVAINTVYI